jgi:hypothetical protein
MAGFFNNIGFTSTAGAFIGGMAKQLNQNLENAEALRAAADQAWGVKVDKAAQDFNKQFQQDKTNTDIYRYFQREAGGDQFLADQMYQRYQANPRADIGKILDDVMRGANSSNYQRDPNYQSSVLSGIQARQNALYGNLQGQMNRLNPNIRSRITQPLNPNQYGDRSNYQSDYGSPQSRNPQVQGQGQSSLPSDTTVGDFNTGYNPNFVPSGETTASASPTASPSSGGISVVGPGGIHYSMTPEQYNEYTQTGRIPASAVPSGANTPGATATIPGTYQYQPKPTTRAFNPPNLTPNDFTGDGYQRYLTSIHKYPNDPSKWDLSGVLPHEQINPKPTNEDKVDVAAQIRAQRNYLDDFYKKRATYTNINTMKELATDADKMIKLTEQGLMADARQPFFDTLNRVLASVGVDTLQQLGIANKVTDTNQAMKVIARLQFGQIPNYHLGRWTDREFAKLAEMLPNLGSDPSTNIKIAMLIKAANERELDHIQKEQKALGTGSANEVREAMKVNYQNNFDTINSELPWKTTDFSTKEDLDTYNKAPVGTYFEYTGTQPIEFNGQIIKHGHMIRKT